MEKKDAALKDLRSLARDTKSKGHGARLKRALLVLAIPATAAMATACYGMPMAQDPHSPYDVTYGPTIYLDGVDCDGDGIADAENPEACPPELHQRDVRCLVIEN